MRFNLKNHPKRSEMIRGLTIVTIVQDYDDWFEGFEKELREKISNIEKAACIYNSWTMARHLKEILGE